MQNNKARYTMLHHLGRLRVRIPPSPPIKSTTYTLHCTIFALLLSLAGCASAESDLDKAERLLNLYAPQFSTTVSSQLSQSSTASLDLKTGVILDKMREGEIAFYCGGMAEVMARIMRDHGLDAERIDMAAGQATHTSVLVTVEGNRYVFDPTFQITLRDPETRAHVAIDDALLLSHQEKRNLVYEISMPERTWVFSSPEQLTQVNESFDGISHTGSQVFYRVDGLKTHRPNFNLGVYIYSVRPHLRLEGLRTDYSVYVDMHDRIVY